MADLCLRCKKEVRKRQEAILCDKCEQWCHRTCGTGIDRAFYRRMVKGEVSIDWQCINCSTVEPQTEIDAPQMTAEPEIEAPQMTADPLESTRLSFGMQGGFQQQIQNSNSNKFISTEHICNSNKLQ